MIKNVLKKAGYQSESVETGSEGIYAVLLGGYDLALIDFHLADMDGITVANIIRDNGCTIPLFLVSGDPEAAATQPNYESAHFSEIFLKVGRVTDLIEMINRALGQTNRLPMPGDEGVEKVEFTAPVATNPLVRDDDVPGGCAP